MEDSLRTAIIVFIILLPSIGMFYGAMLFGQGLKEMREIENAEARYVRDQKRTEAKWSKLREARLWLDKLHKGPRISPNNLVVAWKLSGLIQYLEREVKHQRGICQSESERLLTHARQVQTEISGHVGGQALPDGPKSRRV